ncbi:MAG: protein translocase subunit SecD [Planctomycetota bacterium]|nr:protein translocase subunit SecD [Planctomycetota bacterium]
MYKRTRFGFVVLAIFTALCLWLLQATGANFPLGMDLKGGTELIYELDLSHVERDSRQVANEIKDIIARRLNMFGLKELSLSVEGSNRLVVQLPGSDPATVKGLKDQIEKAGTLSFHLVDATAAQSRNLEELRAEETRYKQKVQVWAKAVRDWDARRKADPGYDAPRPEKDFKAPRYIVREQRPEKDADGNEVPQPPLVLKNTPGNWVPSADPETGAPWLTNVYSFTDPKTLSPAVGFELRGLGATLMGDMTSENLQSRMAVVLDDVVESAPVIQSRISTSGMITGDFTQAEIQALLTVLRGGSLPTSPKLHSESTVGSVFGQESIDSGRRAVIVGISVVMLFIAIYYLAAGLVANFALVFNVVVVLTFVAAFRQDLTLPGIAGILLTIGMAVDANILIFERVREERRRGKALPQALAAGYRRAFSVIFDSNLTTIITGLVLFNFGTGPVKGFAVTLIAGITVSFISALFVTRLILSLALNKGWLTKLRMMRAFETPRVPFVRFQQPFLVASALVILATWCLVIYRGHDNYGVDFTGGARIRMKLREPIPRDSNEAGVVSMMGIIRELQDREPELFREATLQTIRGGVDGSAREFALLTRAGAEQQGTVADAQGARQGDDAGPRPRRPDASKGAEAGEEGGAKPSGATTPAAAAVPAATGPDDATGAAQKVRDALEQELADLLMPPPDPATLEVDGKSQENPYWKTIEGSTRQALILDVNLDAVDETAVNEDDIRDKLTAFLAEYFRWTDVEAPDEKIVCEKVEVVQHKTEGVTRYRVELSAYDVPAIGALSDLPTTQACFAAIASYFSSPHEKEGKVLFEISEPFPQVATVGPRVASDLQGRAVVAIFISMVGIIFYVSLRFEFIFGLAAITALVHDILITIGVMAVTDWFLGDIIPVKINLPELAALLAIIGYSINDTIVVFDRIRENLRTFAKKKMSFRDCVDMSINQTLSRTVWTSLTTLFTVLSLLVLGGEAVRGFAYTFAIGLVAGTYSSVFVASPVLIFLHQRGEIRREARATAMA